MKNSGTDLPGTFGELLYSGAKKYGDATALTHHGQPVSHVELLRRCRQLANSLHAAGVTEGDRVAIALPNGPHFVVAVFAVILAGGIAVPLDVTTRAGTFQYIAHDCGISAIILDSALLSRFQPVLAKHEGIVLYIKDAASPSHWPPHTTTYHLDTVLELHDESLDEPTSSTPPDPATIVSITYTSGSSGQPKGVMHSHRSWLSGAMFTGQYLGVRPRSKMLLPLPLHHAYSFRHILAYLLFGGSLVLADDIFHSLSLMNREQPDSLLLVPSACNLILTYYKDLMRKCRTFVQLVSVGTAPFPASRLRELKDLLPNTRIVLPYGLTEGRVGFLAMDDESSTNRILDIAPGLSVSVLDENGQVVRPDEVGEIVIKGDGVMVGYWGSDDSERRAIQERGVRTGDLGYVNEDGSITLIGRTDDVINVGGKKVDPAEIENILNQHPAVVESLVLSVDDPARITDKRALAMVVLRKGAVASEEELKAHCKRHLEPHKVPIRIEFTEFLPKSSVGKLLRRPWESEV